MVRRSTRGTNLGFLSQIQRGPATCVLTRGGQGRPERQYSKGRANAGSAIGYGGRCKTRPRGVPLTPVSPSPDIDPSWQGASERTAFLRGLAACFSVPGAVLTASAMGFGALARDLGFSIWIAGYLSIVFYALPAQVVVLDQLGRGLSLVAAAFAVSLTAIRLLPMTVTLMPMLRDAKGRRWRELLAVHFIAVTAWIEGLRRLATVPEELRLANFIGFGVSFLMCTVFGAVAGHLLAGVVPPAISAALLFLTPIYFLLSLIASARRLDDYLAIGLGAALGPPMFMLAPGFDLLLAGVIGGSIAWAIGRRR